MFDETRGGCFVNFCCAFYAGCLLIVGGRTTERSNTGRIFYILNFAKVLFYSVLDRKLFSLNGWQDLRATHEFRNYRVCFRVYAFGFKVN